MTLGTMCSLGWGPSRPQLAFPKLSQEKATLLPGLARTKTSLKADWEGLAYRGWRGSGYGIEKVEEGLHSSQSRCVSTKHVGDITVHFFELRHSFYRSRMYLGLGVIREKKDNVSSHWQWNCIMQEDSVLDTRKPLRPESWMCGP